MEGHQWSYGRLLGGNSGDLMERLGNWLEGLGERVGFQLGQFLSHSLHLAGKSEQGVHHC